MQTIARQLLNVHQKINSIHEQYNTLLESNKQKNVVEVASLREIQQELAKLVEKIQSI